MGTKAIIANTEAEHITVNPQAFWDRSQFDDALIQHGYLCYIERALRCPCSVKGVGEQGLTDCENCGGTGWFFIDRQESRVLATSISNKTKYEVWTEANMGTINITCTPLDKLGYMDRVIFLELESWYNEILHVQRNEEDTQSFCFTTYDPIRIFHAFVFEGSKLKHRRLVEGVDFTIDKNKILFIDALNGKTVTLRYTHSPVYHILDINRDLIKQQQQTTCSDPGIRTNFPLSCIGRRAHYIVGAPNFNGEQLFDNTDYTKPINYDI